MCKQFEYPIQTVVNPLKKLLREFDIRENEGRKEYVGYPFLDYKELNQIISGIRGSHLTLLGTPSQNLRSQFMLQIAISVICLNKIPVLYLCYEDSPEKLLKQILSQQTGIPMNVIEHHKIKSNPELKGKLKKGLEIFAKFQSYLSLMPGSQNDTVEQLEVHLDSIKERYKTEKVILMVDSLQRIPSYNNYPSENARITDMANRLKLISNSMGVAVLAGSEITDQGIEIDATDNKERITSQHFLGGDDLHRFADVLMTVSKSWIDNNELQILLRKKAEFYGMDDLKIPTMSILDLFIDKLPNNRMTQSCVQFLGLIENGLLMELGCFGDNVLLRQNRIDKVVSRLIDQKIVEFFPRDSEDNHDSEGFVPRDASIVSQSDQTVKIGEADRKKIKPNIRLNR